jgi:type I restriction enzyme S subunit
VKLEVCESAPDDWARMTLASVCTRVTSGGTPSRKHPEYFGGVIPWVKTQELRDGRINSTEEHLTEEGLAHSSAKLLPEDTVLVAMYGATAGQLGVLAREMTCNQAACALIADASKADYRYLYYQLLNARRQLKALANGAAQQNLSAGTIKDLKVPFPRVAEQRRIGEMLGALDDKIDCNQRIAADSQALADHLFLGAEAEQRTLGEVATITMGSSPPGSTYNETDDGLPFYQGTRDFGFRFPGQRIWCSAPVRVADVGDVLISVRAPVGRLNVAPLKCCIGRGLAAARSATPSTLLYSLRAASRVWAPYEGEGTVFGAINRDNLAAIPVGWPESAALPAMENQLALLDSRVRTAMHEVEHLSQLRDTLLPRLMSGQLRFKDAEASIEAVA